MSDKRLKEIRDSIELQLELCKQLKVNDEMILEEKELSDEVDKLNNIINANKKATKLLTDDLANMTKQALEKDNIINELEKYLFNDLQEYGGGGYVQEIYDKLKELKEE